MNSIEILQTEMVKDAEVLLVQAATYQGSKPFSGNFHFWDLDEMIHTDPVTGKEMARVFCSFGDEPYHEGSIIEIELISVEAGCSGFDGEVVRRMRWAS